MGYPECLRVYAAAGNKEGSTQAYAEKPEFPRKSPRQGMNGRKGSIRLEDRAYLLVATYINQL